MGLLRSFVGLGVVASVSLLGVACGGNDNSGQAPPATSQTAKDAEAMLGPIDTAISSPTGTVTADSAKSVFVAYTNQGTAGSALANVPGGAPAPTSQGEGGGANCITMNGSGGTIDLGCMSGGTETGKVTYATGSDQGYTYFTFSYDNVCGKAGDCITGKGAEKIKGTYAAGGSNMDVTLAGDFDVTANGKSVHVSYGYKMTVNNGQYTVEYAIFDDKGDSYTVTAKVGGGSGQWTVKGKNGDYTCTYTNSGENGQCQGADGKSFTW
jgi:hypothetical protein